MNTVNPPSQPKWGQTLEVDHLGVLIWMKSHDPCWCPVALEVLHHGRAMDPELSGQLLNG